MLKVPYSWHPLLVCSINYASAYCRRVWTKFKFLKFFFFIILAAAKIIISSCSLFTMVPGSNADANPPEDDLRVLALWELVELLHLLQLGDGKGAPLQQAYQERLHVIMVQKKDFSRNRIWSGSGSGSRHLFRHFVNKTGLLHSVADPNFSILDPGSGVEKIPDPGSGSASKNLRIFKPQKLFLSSRKYDLGCSSRIRILIFYPFRIQGSKRQRIPDPQHFSYIPVRSNFKKSPATLPLPKCRIAPGAWSRFKNDKRSVSGYVIPDLQHCLFLTGRLGEQERIPSERSPNS